MRYLIRLRSDTAPGVVYDVLCQAPDAGIGPVRALACTCPDDEHRGSERPCKHRVRAELAPAFSAARRRLILSGIVGERVVTPETLERFAQLFHESVASRRARGTRDPVVEVIAAVIRRADLVSQ